MQARIHFASEALYDTQMDGDIHSSSIYYLNGTRHWFEFWKREIMDVRFPTYVRNGIRMDGGIHSLLNGGQKWMRGFICISQKNKNESQHLLVFNSCSTRQVSNPLGVWDWVPNGIKIPFHSQIRIEVEYKSFENIQYLIPMALCYSVQCAGNWKTYSFPPGH